MCESAINFSIKNICDYIGVIIIEFETGLLIKSNTLNKDNTSGLACMEDVL